MSRFHSYINSTKEILSVYAGGEPLSAFLKKYFAANKKFGSKDRKHIAHLCYCFFRLGKAVMNVSMEEKIVTGLFLCADRTNEILAALKPAWNEKTHLPAHEKLLIINYSLLIENVFPWKSELSDQIDHEEFCRSFFIQPDLFIRLRPGKEKLVTEKLKHAGIDFQVLSSTCLSLPNSSKIDAVIELDNEVVIQDYSSQRTGAFIKSEILKRNPINGGTKIKVWDCCAGSGGKSIMLYDTNPEIELSVSDIRESILANLKKRFAAAGIKNYRSFVIDLLSDKSVIGNLQSEIIIADVPCTGSGTWSRTPEQLYFFDETEIENFSTLQKRIVSNAILQLQKGGTFIYITCSVFKKENEDVVKFIAEKFKLELKHMEILNGYDKRADSMFVAVLGLPAN